MFIFSGLHISALSALTHLGEELVPQICSSTLLLPEGVSAEAPQVTFQLPLEEIISMI